MRGKNGGSLTFPDNPLASMQELSALDAPAPRADRTPRTDPEIIKERSNEVSFIASEFPKKETSEEVIQETLPETPNQTKSEPKKVAPKLRSNQERLLRSCP